MGLGVSQPVSIPKDRGRSGVDRSRRSAVDRSCTRYRILRSCYERHTRPPRWVLENCTDILAEHGKSTWLFYSGDNGDNAARQEAWELAKQREPVNIGMVRMYDLERLKTEFGWSTGYYEEASNGGEIYPPQIAISCDTPISWEGQWTVVSVVNVIGIAFDDPRQTDVRIFGEFPLSTRRVRKDMMFDFLKYMRIVYQLAFEAARKAKKTLVLAAIGASAFRPRNWRTEGAFIRDVIVPCVVSLRSQFPDVDTIESWEDPIRIPDGLFLSPSRIYEDISDKMFMNAWDCWSIPGNGNFADDSLDGYWGRSSAISLLCWPLSNPYMKAHVRRIYTGSPNRGCRT